MDFEQDSEHFKVLMDVVAWKINKLSLFFSFSQFWAFYVFLFQFKYELWAKYWNKMLVNQNASHHTVKKAVLFYGYCLFEETDFEGTR